MSKNKIRNSLYLQLEWFQVICSEDERLVMFLVKSHVFLRLVIPPLYKISHSIRLNREIIQTFQQEI